MITNQEKLENAIENLRSHYDGLIADNVGIKEKIDASKKAVEEHLKLIEECENKLKENRNAADSLFVIFSTPTGLQSENPAILEPHTETSNTTEVAAVKPAKKSPGRPKKIKVESTVEPIAEPEVKPKKGRPLGSTKPKEAKPPKVVKTPKAPKVIQDPSLPKRKPGRPAGSFNKPKNESPKITEVSEPKGECIDNTIIPSSVDASPRQPIVTEKQLTTTNPIIDKKNPTLTFKDLEKIFFKKTGQIFDDFYKNYRSKLVWHLQQKTDPDTAQDHTDEAFMQALTNINTYIPKSEGGAAIHTWVFRIGENINKKAFKDRSRLPLTSLDKENEDNGNLSNIIPYYDGSDENEEHQIKSKKAEIIINAIANLSVKDEKYKKVLELREFDGMAYKEIANDLSLNLSTMKSQLKKGRHIILKKVDKKCKDLDENGLDD